MTAQHPLGRPVWNALASRRRPFAVGDPRATRFDGAFGGFGAMADASPEGEAALAALVARRGRLALLEAETPLPIAGVAAEAHVLWQMTERLIDRTPPAFAIVPLTDADAPEMLRLAKLTKPGPFFVRTHELGTFLGVRHEGVLVAMAVERMKPDGFTEVSGVCTATNHRGRGYSGALVSAIAEPVLARGETPILHADAHNADAIRQYQALGFALRRKMHLHVLSFPQE